MRETIGDLVIPGVTHVDPNLAQYDAQPLHIPGPSPSQSLAGPVMGAAMHNPALGMVALAGLGAVAANEFMSAGRGQMSAAEIEKLGQLSEPVQQMLKKLDEEEKSKPNAGDPPAGAADEAPEPSDGVLPPSEGGPGWASLK